MIEKLPEEPQNELRNVLILKINELIDIVNKPVRQPRRKTANTDSKKS